jgi:hypothetical protein
VIASFCVTKLWLTIKRTAKFASGWHVMDKVERLENNSFSTQPAYNKPLLPRRQPQTTTTRMVLSIGLAVSVAQGRKNKKKIA